jgi:hypothetical protein
MFSLDSFYKIIAKNMLEPLGINSLCFSRFGSTNFNDLIGVSDRDYKYDDENNDFIKYLVFYDQEPIDVENFQESFLKSNLEFNINFLDYQVYCLKSYSTNFWYVNQPFNVYANSEISDQKSMLFKNLDFYDWYYFFHGFAALDWYKNVKYMPPIKTFSKVFISFNNLVNEKRSYRLTLISTLIKLGLDKYGYISMNQQDTVNKIKKELSSPYSLLSKQSKYLIYKTLLPNPPKLIIDIDTTVGTLSADDNLETLSLGLFHVVTETIFYDKKLHLTEKIFKPVVARRPFLLVGAPGNLAYLKSYGFKTFDRWIDESYDLETDPDQRLNKIVNELDKLCKLPELELMQIYNEMQEILEYNFHWFYNGFRKQITNEMVDNFESLIKKYNTGKDASFSSYINLSKIDLDAVKQLLLQ